MRGSLVTYITAHGFGHATRCCDVLAALGRRRPGLPITVVSDLPEWFLRSRLPSATLRRGSFDVGMVQTDAVRVDLERTLERLQSLLGSWDEMREGESRWLSRNQVRAVLADVPALPLEAAVLAGVPQVQAISNFSWDWIYAEHAQRDARWRPAVDRFAQAYAAGAELLRYPFHGDFPAFGRIRDVPLVASPGLPQRGQLAQELGLDPAKLWLLFVFAELDFTEEGRKRLESLEGVELLTTGRLNWRGSQVHNLEPAAQRFADLVASVDAVVSKPGFGILSDCVANRTPLIFVPRTDFREAAVLVEAARRHLSHFEMPLKDLYSGRFEEPLEALRAGFPEPPEPLVADGADQVAGLLLEGL